MRQPILTLQQAAEYAAVQAEAASMSPDASFEERVLMTRRLSIYSFGAQHLGESERRIMARFPARQHTLPETGYEDIDQP